MNLLQEQLFSLADVKYKNFHQKLIPTVAQERIMGIPTPKLRKFAKDFARQPESTQFLMQLPHFYYEENNLHGFLIETKKDYEETLRLTNDFLPFVDNWATCDMFAPPIFGKETQRFYQQIRQWIKSPEPYTVRFAVVNLTRYYLEDRFSPEALSLAAKVRHENYYVKMAVAWFFSVALVKQEDAALPYFQDQRLDKWTHNKALQKARESKRLSKEKKDILKALKR